MEENAILKKSVAQAEFQQCCAPRIIFLAKLTLLALCSCLAQLTSYKPPLSFTKSKELSLCTTKKPLGAKTSRQKCNQENKKTSLLVFTIKLYGNSGRSTVRKSQNSGPLSCWINERAKPDKDQEPDMLRILSARSGHTCPYAHERAKPDKDQEPDMFRIQSTHVQEVAIRALTLMKGRSLTKIRNLICSG